MHSSNDSSDSRRLFFALELEAAWPEQLPNGRILEEKERHMTLSFLGDVSWAELQRILPSFPTPPSVIGAPGKCDRLIFLPEKGPRVVAGHIDWFGSDDIQTLQKNVVSWLDKHHYKVDHRPFLPHVTLARAPFEIDEWKKVNVPFPVIVKGIHLYQTVACLRYEPLWSLPLLSPIVECEHTADIAFLIRGETLQQLFLNSQVALALKFPQMLNYFLEGSGIENLDSLIIKLNKLITRADSDIGCPFKAISFHGDIFEKNGTLNWEMIVDV